MHLGINAAAHLNQNNTSDENKSMCIGLPSCFIWSPLPLSGLPPPLPPPGFDLSGQLLI